MRAMVVAGLMCVAGAGLATMWIFLRRAYVRHISYKELRAELDASIRRARFDEAMQESYSDGYDAGYRRALKEQEDRQRRGEQIKDLCRELVVEYPPERLPPPPAAR